MNYLNNFVQYGIPILACFISFLSLKDSRKANKITNKVQELEEKIKIYELEDKENEREASIEVRTINKAPKKYKLKIWNAGKDTAYNIDFDEIHNDTDYQNNVIRKDKTPYEYLEGGKSYEEIMLTFVATPPKFEVLVKWYDKNSKFQSKKQIVTIP